jgi:hypothetical protein
MTAWHRDEEVIRINSHRHVSTDAGLRLARPASAVRASMLAGRERGGAE